MKVGEPMTTNEKWNFLSNKSLESKIQSLEEKLNKKQLTLDYHIDDRHDYRTIDLRVVSLQDESTIIVDNNSFNMSNSIFVDKFTNRLEAIESNVDFLAFVVNTVLRIEIAHMSKQFFTPIEITDLQFNCKSKDDDPDVTFHYNKEGRLYNVGSGRFEQEKHSTVVHFGAGFTNIHMDSSSITVRGLPENVWFELETEIGHQRYIDIVLHVYLNGDYDDLTIKGAKQVATDFANMLKFARSYSGSY